MVSVDVKHHVYLLTPNINPLLRQPFLDLWVASGVHIYIPEVPLYVQCAVHVLNAMYTFLCAALLGKGTLNANQSMVALLNLLLLKLEIFQKKILDLMKMKCRSDFAGGFWFFFFLFSTISPPIFRHLSLFIVSH